MQTTSPDTSTTGRHIPALDGIRGVAVLLVMVCHIWGNYWPPNFLFAKIAVSGWVGVDMFFALSGFLLTGILYDTRDGSHYFRNFYARRSLRIFPLYYLYLGLTVVIGLLMGVHFYPRMLLYFTYTQNLFPATWRHSTGREASADWVTVSHFWSLAVEEHFYLFWPAVVYLLRTKRRIAAAAGSIALCSFLLRCAVHLSGLARTYPDMAYIWTPVRLDTLLLGAVLAIAVRSRWRELCIAAGPVLAAAGIAVTAAYALLRRLDFIGDPWVQTVGFAVVGLWSTALVASVLRRGSVAERFFQIAPLRFLGRYSYGIYVLHLLIDSLLMTHLAGRLIVLLHSHTAGRALASLLVIPVSVAAAVVSFHLFEEPMLRLKRHFQDDSPTPKLRRQLQAQPAED